MRNFMRRQPFMKRGLRELVSCLGEDLIGVEIGCYVGESTEIFCKSGKFEKFFAVDPWENGYDKNDKASSKRSMVIVENMFDKRMSKYCNLVKVKKKSEIAVNDFEDNSLDFVYIDGNHQYNSVKQDIKNWLPKIKDNGIISGHDYNLDGVNKAIKEELGEPMKTFADGSWLFNIRG